MKRKAIANSPYVVVYSAAEEFSEARPYIVSVLFKEHTLCLYTFVGQHEALHAYNSINTVTEIHQLLKYMS